MDDKFDKDLTNRIREVFEDYSYPPADEGWAQLRKKFPAEGKKDKIAWLWWGSAAALLLLFLGVGLWLRAPENGAQGIAHNDVVKSKLQDTSANTSTAVNPVPDNKAPVSNKSDSGATDNKFNSPAETTTPGTLIDKYDNGLAVTNSGKKQASGNKLNLIVQDNPFPTNANSQGLTTNNQLITKPIIDSSAVTIYKANQPQIAQVEKAETIDNAPGKPQSAPSKTIAQLLQDDNKNVIAKKTQPNKREDSRKVNFSVYAATYLNYAQGSANQVNAGAGFTSDIKIGGNFKLSTGVSLAQNSLRYDNGKPVGGGGGADYYNTPSATVLRQDVSGFAVNSTSQVSQNYNARLIGLDVPVNIKYEFNPQKSDTYISAGLSSGTFIDERYTQSFTYQSTNLSTSAVTTQTQDDTETKSFNNFYFGKMLNVSFGIGYPIGKSNRLIIEPFLKYPLAGLGAQDLKFGAGGLNLKINFSGTKR